MTPTNELRFVEREECVSLDTGERKTFRILQQKWVDPHDKYQEGEWRDVPCVKEELK